MRAEDIEIGMLVRVRAWEDMEAEFGLNGNGHIRCPLTYTTTMKEVYPPGLVMRVSRLDGCNDPIMADITNGSKIPHNWHASMVEPAQLSSLIRLPRLSLLEQLENAPEHLYKHILEISV